MLTFEEAKKIGIGACVEKLGHSFVKQYADSFCSAYGWGKDENTVFCFAGIDDNPEKITDTNELILTSNNDFPYRVSCNVNILNSSISYVECIVPKTAFNVV